MKELRKNLIFSYSGFLFTDLLTKFFSLNIFGFFRLAFS